MRAPAPHAVVEPPVFVDQSRVSVKDVRRISAKVLHDNVEEKRTDGNFAIIADDRPSRIAHATKKFKIESSHRLE